MKIKKTVSVILAVLLLIGAIPLSGGARYREDYGKLIVLSDEPLYEWFNGFGVRTDYDVDYTDNTLYVNTSKFLQIELPPGVTGDFRIVFEHNADVVLNGRT